MRPGILLLAALGLTSIAGGLGWCAGPNSEATITSDELEIQNNGERTYFRGHVVLKEDPYLLNADRMVRTKATGIVDASGHLDGTWFSEKGEKVKAYGDTGSYDPALAKTEMWGKNARMMRWETVKDTAPVQVTADRFIAYHQEREFMALGRVVITQKPKVLTRSEKAKYDQKTQTIHLYGPSGVFVHIADAKGSGDFTAEKGWLTLEPKTAHMEGHVQGHVDPGQTL